MKSIYIYIHYPFCDSKCPYCSFYSLVDAKYSYPDYEQKLLHMYKKQLDYYYNYSKDSIVQTIFFGGGTPSIASSEFLSDIIEYIFMKWSRVDKPEISIEVNPFSSSFDKFFDYKNIGINRISIGIQSLDDSELKFLGRLHSAKTALQTIDHAHNFFNNISADFIYGLPHHTYEGWKKNLERIINLNLPHYSLYQLTIEKHTPFFNFVKCGRLMPASDLIQSKLFRGTRTFMNKSRVYSYEISNFAKIGFECKHNLAYWTNQNYIGIGPSAQSRIDKFAFVNSQINWDKIKMKKLSRYEKAEEIILTSLRSKYGLKLTDYLISILNFDVINDFSKFIKYNKQKNVLKMTEKGFLYFDSIIEKIIK